MSDSVGLFVVVEGPNGVGKTTVCAALMQALAAEGVRAHSTAEPSRTPLGNAIRELEASMPPRALALTCAADREDHLVREVQPLLKAGIHVTCDRYLPSSLVLQRLDGFELEWIWSLNYHVLPPDLTVYLEHDPETIRARLGERYRHSRFERIGSSALELEYFREAHEFLSRKGWSQTVIDCRSKPPAAIAAQIRERLR